MRGIVIAMVALAVAAGGSAERPIDVLERAVAEHPEDLKLAADYRRLAIAAKDFDRAIKVFEKLAKRKGSGSHAQISLALAYVDKVPTSGEIRRLYLGRDAANALSKAIARQPTALAYYLRGLINLYYNNFIFHRVPNGIADLEHALAVATPETPPALLARVYTALGDGQYKLGNLVKAREAWSAGRRRFPGDGVLNERLAAEGESLHDLVTTALSPERRVDTTVSEFYSEP